ncbi:colipase-like protein 1 [Oryctolagus cuniculus]|uniref:colipase-like protein 1 n=1 Tax=Oryctolagus cuniculus TaxID=9986 RepID=UPI0003905470|nr:colipase-like protein 1 [Oryctolagus cuniculus]
MCLRLLQLLLLCLFFLLTRGSFWKSTHSDLNINEICIQSSRCKSGCCRRAPEICESYCSRRGSEGHLCHTQMFSGLYNECPCQLNLTCVFPKNQKSFHIIYGRCQKMAKKKQTKKGFF